MPYIEKNELLNGIYSDNPKDVMLYIARFPTADVVERKKGKWNLVEYPDGYYHTECSECGCEYSENVYFDHDAKFCPSCGADMRGEE